MVASASLCPPLVWGGLFFAQNRTIVGQDAVRRDSAHLIKSAENVRRMGSLRCGGGTTDIVRIDENEGRRPRNRLVFKVCSRPLCDGITRFI